MPVSLLTDSPSSLKGEPVASSVIGPVRLLFPADRMDYSIPSTEQKSSLGKEQKRNRTDESRDDICQCQKSASRSA